MWERSLAEISQTGDLMLTVLETVAHGGPINAADIARVCDINRTVAHRLLSTLETRAYVRRGPKGYALGGAVVNLARHLENDISTVARPQMEKLAERVGETVVLHCVDKDQAMVVEQALGEKYLVRVQHTPGSRHPLFLGASGWSLLAFQDDKTIARVLKKAPDPKIARKRIDEIRSQRYAISHDELQMGVHGISAPLFDATELCVASIAILVPADRSERLQAMLPHLIETATTITNELQQPAAWGDGAIRK
ncbi:IclR family transcriptional regulator protein (plasmid) [Rhizobium etli]|uniref:IclR family transcriptional regulator protein n=1 Tax=Rhizobium etli TaxID=29449 RepID=A0AAN1ENU8_RHIET|nr:IclR family transcriptional regulator protein [Rhizobium etli]